MKTYEFKLTNSTETIVIMANSFPEAMRKLREQAAQQ